jgi:poly-gamma-glutamate synthesis protein (capsule biosynthesis protein)
MGDERKTETRRGIRDYAEGYIKLGADIVFASHPHTLQPVEMYETKLEDGSDHKGIIFYSLGNFVSGMYGITCETGAIAYVTLRRDNISGDISILGSEYLPTSTLRHGNYGDLYHILPIGQFLDFPEQYEDINPDSGCFYRLEHEWNVATSILGDEVSKILRYMPQRDD